MEINIANGLISSFQETAMIEEFRETRSKKRHNIMMRLTYNREGKDACCTGFAIGEIESLHASVLACTPKPY